MTPPTPSTIFEVRAEFTPGHLTAVGARRSRAEAEALMLEWVERGNNVSPRTDRYWIEEIDTTGLFELPSKPTPRERYSTRVTAPHKPNTWQTVHVVVLDGDTVIASYDRNYSYRVSAIGPVP